MGNEQHAVDRSLSRRRMLKWLGIGSIVSVAGCSTNNDTDTDTTTPSVIETTVGPQRQSVLTTESADLTATTEGTTALVTESASPTRT